MLNIIRALLSRHLWVKVSNIRSCSICSRQERLDDESLEWGEMDWKVEIRGNIALHWAPVRSPDSSSSDACNAE